MKGAYLLIDFFTIIVPFLFSFHPRLLFFRTWRAFFPAVILTGLFFVLWDIYFTDIKVWGFNPNYVTGTYIVNLPLEEVIFFFCIPYSCVFTFYCLNIFIKKPVSKKIENIITILLIVSLLILAVLFHDRKYTLCAFSMLIALLIISRYWLKITWLGKFYLIYCVLLFPFLIVNGLLTGTGIKEPIVWYNHAEIIGLRILTIPFEDIFYGMDLIFLNLLIYKYLIKKASLKVI